MSKIDVETFSDFFLSKVLNADNVAKSLNFHNPIDSINLSNGLSGVLAFLGICKSQKLNTEISEICHKYIKTISEKLQNSYYDLSLYKGITGVIFSIYLSSNNGFEYQNLINTLETHLREEILRHLILPIEKATNNNYLLHPSSLNLSSGLSGIIAYLTLRIDSCRENNEILDKCTQTLANYLERNLVHDDKNVPGWYSPYDESLHYLDKHKYPNGSFALSHAYGISGYLAALTTYLECRQGNQSIFNLVEKLSNWLINVAEKKPDGYFWPISASYEEVLKGQYSEHLNRDSWFCGIPSIALTLYRVGKLLNKKKFCEFAEKAYLSLFEKNFKDWNLIATQLFYGRAGVLLTTHRMALLTNNQFLINQRSKLEDELLRYYNPSNLFGFRSVETTEGGNFSWEDNPGLLFGASGTILTLMTINNPEFENWDRILLTT